VVKYASQVKCGKDVALDKDIDEVIKEVTNSHGVVGAHDNCQIMLCINILVIIVPSKGLGDQVSNETCLNGDSKMARLEEVTNIVGPNHPLGIAILKHT
jgi:hypothetical protein